MIRSNSAQAVRNIRLYVLQHFSGCNYSPVFDHINNAIDTLAKKRLCLNSEIMEVFRLVALAIDSTFSDEMLKNDNRYHAGRASRFDLFANWCAGLPSLLDTCYYYNRSAVHDLGNILQETEEEKARYTEAEAEQRLTWLIYREIRKITSKEVF